MGFIFREEQNFVPFRIGHDELWGPKCLLLNGYFTDCKFADS